MPGGDRRGPDRSRRTPFCHREHLRQKEQQVVKDGWAKIGVGVTLQSVDAGVFFSSSPGNNDTAAHFYRDVEMYTNTFTSPFPNQYMAQWYSGDPSKTLAQKENNWYGLNISRWVNQEYNQLYDQVQSELDPKKSDPLWIRMNDIVVTEGASLPIIDRRIVSAHVNTLDVGANMSPFDSETRNIADWRRKA